jgi:hypothetical protein
MSLVLFLGTLLALVLAAGLCGGWLAGRKSPDMESRIESAWSVGDRARWLRNIGFLCGAVSSAAVLFAVWVGGWLRVP